ncbi:hypothetical protein [Amycolatopsis nigrescens]|uniref:hypothetical protein n=1 Tax=Amycolatopsis nigrescens TaxID=381445 RepID=UPI0003760BB9|nr:hypothetical protein [Amycolatopsis nigrescens]
MPHGTLRWNTLAVAAAVGIAIVAVAWYLGPGLFGTAEAEQGTVVEARVTLGMECASPDAKETVQFELAGKTRNGTLTACGHDREQRVKVVVPADVGTGLIDVKPAGVVEGRNDLRRPVGLVLVALSCVGGGSYAFLVARGPRNRRSRALA